MPGSTRTFFPSTKHSIFSGALPELFLLDEADRHPETTLALAGFKIKKCNLESEKQFFISFTLDGALWYCLIQLKIMLIKII